MRKFADRPDLPEKTVLKLLEKRTEIVGIVDLEARKTRAREIFDASLGTAWFGAVKEKLQGLCGAGQLCMYCSSTEPSQVEHYKPLALFPELAMEYVNYLWSCDICNRTYKGSKFPPLNCAGGEILNPLDDNVWDFFYIDHTFGRLMKRIDPNTRAYFSRAESTCTYVGVDREVVQLKRQARYKAIVREVAAIISKYRFGELDKEAAEAATESLRLEPFQADVADYFLNGPGKIKAPFDEFFAIIEAP